MRIRRFAKMLAAFLAGVMLAQLVYACSPRTQAAEKTRLTIAYAVTQPPHVNVNEILIRPTQQE